MKKFISTILTAAVALSSLSLAACSDEEAPPVDYGAAPDPNSFASERVTEQQWSNALRLSAITNVTANARAKNDSFTGRLDEMKIDGLKWYAKAAKYEDSSSVPLFLGYEEIYVSYSDDNMCTEYVFDEVNGWVADSEYYSYDRPSLADFIGVMSSYSFRYSNFDYNDGEGCYVYGTDKTTQKLKFIDAKLRYLFIRENRDGENQYIEYNIYNYGTTTVTLPPVINFDE